MQDYWYGDWPDVLKWSGLSHIADLHKMQTILWIAYYRNLQAPWRFQVDDGDVIDIQECVRSHFPRSLEAIKNMKCRTKIKLFDQPFDPRDRTAYRESVCGEIERNESTPKIIFLDPDTGILSDNAANGKHVKLSEVRQIWECTGKNDILALFQQNPRNPTQNPITDRVSEFEQAIDKTAQILHKAGIDWQRFPILMFARK